jgi:hypothetical protein
MLLGSSRNCSQKKFALRSDFAEIALMISARAVDHWWRHVDLQSQTRDSEEGNDIERAPHGTSFELV